MIVHKQEYKVVNTEDNTEVFFSPYDFKKAFWHANYYVNNNLNKFPMSLYHKDLIAKTKQPWVLVEEYPVK